MRAKIAGVLGITALCLGWVLWRLDFGVARLALANARWGFLAPMFALYGICHALRTWRLGLLLGAPVPFRRLFLLNSVGFLAINVIPLRLGEFVRPYLLSEREGVPFGRGMAAIVLERLLDMGMLLGLLLGLTLVVDLPSGGVTISVQGAEVDVVRVAQRAAGLLVGAGALFGAGLVVVGEPAIRLVERLPMGLRVASFARRFREGFLALVAQPARALLLVAISASIWALTVAAVGTVMAGFDGLPAGMGPALSTWTITIAGMTAAPTPGFLGPYEAACTAALELWGVNASLAGTFALVLHFGQLIFTLAIGGASLLIEGLSLGQLIRPAPPPESA